MVIELTTLLEFAGSVFKTIIIPIIIYFWKQLRDYKCKQEKLEEAREKRREEVDAQRELEMKQIKAGLQCLARDRLIQAHSFYTSQRWIPIHVLSGLIALYESYEALGENGVIDNLMEQVKSLPNYAPEEDK